MTWVIFFKGSYPSHDDNGKTIDNIEKRFFAFNYQQKSSIKKKIIFFGLPVTGNLLYRHFQYKN